MSDWEALQGEIRRAQKRHRVQADRVRGLFVPYFRRGVLSVPAFKMSAGGDPKVQGREQSLKLMSKAAQLPADCFFYDLEDAAPDQAEFKQFAREFAVEALLTHDFADRVVAFRPNNIRTEYFEQDVLQVIRAAGHKLQMLVIPKTENADEVADIAKMVQRINELAGNSNKLYLEVLIESPRAFLQAQQIAQIPQVTALVFGAYDFARTVGGEVDAKTWLRDQTVVRQMLPIIAASEGKDAVDAVTATLPLKPPRTPHLPQKNYDLVMQPGYAGHWLYRPGDFGDGVRARHYALDLVRRDAQDARKLGFAAKWILHPDQIAPIQKAWVPTRARALEALQLAAAYAKSAIDGSGAQRHGLKMADKAVVAADWALVQAALRALVLSSDDIADNGFSIEQLQRSMATRDSPIDRPTPPQQEEGDEEAEIPF